MSTASREGMARRNRQGGGMRRCRYESCASARDMNSRAARHKKVTFIGVLYQQRAPGDEVPSTKCLRCCKKEIRC